MSSVEVNDENCGVIPAGKNSSLSQDIFALDQPTGRPSILRQTENLPTKTVPKGIKVQTVLFTLALRYNLYNFFDWHVLVLSTFINRLNEITKPSVYFNVFFSLHNVYLIYWFQFFFRFVFRPQEEILWLKKLCPRASLLICQVWTSALKKWMAYIWISWSKYRHVPVLLKCFFIL